MIVDRNERVGDNWRSRYHHLVLHDPVWYDHMPYLSFPPHWPVFTPKDKLGDWFESYASALELNVWMKTTIKSSIWEDGKRQWTVVLERVRDGKTETRRLSTRQGVLQLLTLRRDRSSSARYTGDGPFRRTLSSVTYQRNRKLQGRLADTLLKVCGSEKGRQRQGKACRYCWLLQFRTRHCARLLREWL